MRMEKLKRGTSPKRQSPSVTLLVSSYAANHDQEYALQKAFGQRLGLASRGWGRLACGALALLVVGHARYLAYGKGEKRKRAFALILRLGIVGGAQDLVRSVSRHPNKPSASGNVALQTLSQDLQEEFLQVPHQ